MNTKPYTYVLVRSDLTPVEQIVVQACHASQEAGFAFDAPPRTSSLIVCTVPDQEALRAARDRLARYGINCKMFFEPDWEMGYSALASQPVYSRKHRDVFAIYPLLRLSLEPAAEQEPEAANV